MSGIKQFKVSEENRGERLDLFLAGRLKDYSRSRLQGLIREGKVLVNGAKTKPHHRLTPGEKVEIQLPPSGEEGPQPQSIPLDVIYEDADIIVVNKPPGLLVHPVKVGRSGTLVNALLARAGRLSTGGGPLRPGIVHRLDRDTSGVLVAAKNDEAHRELTRQFKERLLEKIYLALVRGNPPAARGELNYPIGRSGRRRTKMTVKYIGGRESLTGYELLESFSGYSYLQLLLKTGRTHQIRVHLARAGCPVLGDRRYGRGGAEAARELGAVRQMLHAHRLKLAHPKTGEAMIFFAPLPADMEIVLSALRRGKL